MLLKVTVAMASLYFIYKRVIEKENFTGFKIFIDRQMLLPQTWLHISIITGLMFLNWMTEAIKWKLLISKITQIKFTTSLAAVFSGVTVSFFTPNRVGEFAGRMMFLNSEVRTQSVLSTVIGSISQLIITIVAGLTGVCVLLQRFYTVSISMHIAIIVLSTAICIVLVFLFLRLGWVAHFRFIEKLPANAKKYVSVFNNYSSSDFKKVLAYSFIRFLLFTLQYWLFLNIAGVKLPLITAVLCISIIFLVLAVIPTIAFAELAFRGSVAIAVLQVITPDTNGILIASFGLWFVNLALPAAIGSVMFLYFKFKTR